MPFFAYLRSKASKTLEKTRKKFVMYSTHNVDNSNTNELSASGKTLGLHPAWQSCVAERNTLATIDACMRQEVARFHAL